MRIKTRAWRQPTVLAFCLALVLVAAGQSAHGSRVLASPPGTTDDPTSYYVDPLSGSDSNPGTLALPWKSLRHAAAAARAGDTTYLRGGNYAEPLALVTHHGSPGAPIAFVAFPGEQVTLLDTGALGIEISVNWTVVHGVRVLGADTAGALVSGAQHNVLQCCEFAGGGGVGVNLYSHASRETSNNTVRYCVVRDWAQEGIYVKHVYDEDGQVAGNVIEGNLVQDNRFEGVQNTTDETIAPWGTIIRYNTVSGGGDWAGGMDLVGDRLLVEGNIIYQNRGGVGGVWYAHGENSTIINNVFADNAGTWQAGRAGIHLYRIEKSRVLHNTAYGNAGAGIYIEDCQETLRVENNLLSQNSRQLVLRGDNVRIDRNLIDGYSLEHGQSAVFGPSGLIDPALGDYRLQADSMAIDSGADVDVNHDLEGTVRPQGEGYDIGAYEYAAAAEVEGIVSEAYAMSGNACRVLRLSEGDACYTGGEAALARIPPELGSAWWVTPSLADGASHADAYLVMQLDSDAWVYVAYDAGAERVPYWLGCFERSSAEVVIADPQEQSFRLYRRHCPAGMVALGGNMAKGAAGDAMQYVVAVVQGAATQQEQAADSDAGVAEFAVGWNLLALPEPLAAERVPAALEGMGVCYDYASALQRSATKSRWLTYASDGQYMGTPLPDAQPVGAVWVHLLEPAEIALPHASGQTEREDSPPAQGVVLQPGWNLVGYRGQITIPLREALRTVTDQGIVAAIHEPSRTVGTSWPTYSSDLPCVMNEATSITPSRGLWIHVSAAATWNGGI